MAVTTYSGLNKPSDGQENAGEDYNDNMDVLDGVSRIELTCGEALTQYYLGYIASDGKAYQADNSATDSAEAVGFIKETTAAESDEYFIRNGVITNGAWSFTKGQPVYVGTGGGITQTEPGISRRVGIAMDTTKLIVNITW